LLLALALAVAEECLIQQTSLAPMVLKLKGEVYARAYGVNYVYFLWALSTSRVCRVRADTFGRIDFLATAAGRVGEPRRIGGGDFFFLLAV